jgi:ribose transport system ATP-binding protein
MTTASPDTALLRVERVSKRFGITQALGDVSVSFLAGEVHALMGENGAGKSTLGKCIAGLHKADAGTITIGGVGGGGRALKPGSIDDAFEAGVRIVHQELAQCPNLTVAENLCLHDIPRTRLGLVDRRAMADRAARLVHRLDSGIDVRAPLGSLAPGRRQIVQIASSLDDRAEAQAGKARGDHGAGGARVIVFDEPTSSLSVAEADRLLEITRRLAAEGITIIYVSHRMGEIFAVSDRVTVLRDGKYVATSRVKDIDEATLVEQMIGRRLDAPVRRSARGAGGNGDATEAAALRVLLGGGEHHAPDKAAQQLLDVRGLSSPGKLRDVSLEVAPGEIVGVGGLVGSGRSELLDAVFGLDPAAKGQVLVDGSPIDRSSPRGAIRAGVGYVPEDRRLQGLFFQLGIDENIIMPVMPRLARLLGFRNTRAERTLVNERMVSFRVKAASPRSAPGELSGGNQQKLLIARWMGRATRVLLLDEPTRGIDVGTKAEIYKLIRAAADSGAAVLLVSSEMPELLALSDRIIVLCQGRLTGELIGERMTQANILRLATADDTPGLRRGPAAAAAG